MEYFDDTANRIGLWYIRKVPLDNYVMIVWKKETRNE